MPNQQTTITHRFMRNRSRLDIAATILKVINAKEASKTRIMYRAYVSYSQIREYIPMLLGNDLVITTDGQGSLYSIRDRGVRFLEIYDRLNNMIASNNRDSGY